MLTVAKKNGSLGFAPSNLGVVTKKHQQKQRRTTATQCQGGFLLSEKQFPFMAGVDWLYNSRKVKTNPTLSFVGVFLASRRQASLRNLLVAFSTLTKEKIMSSIISIQDLNTTINHEPRIQDVRIGEALGMARPTNIRQQIEANKQELSSYGDICTECVQIQKAGRPANTYYLNEAQAILICMFSKAEKAAEVRKAVIDVFMAYRRSKENTAVIASTSSTRSISSLKELEYLTGLRSALRDSFKVTDVIEELQAVDMHANAAYRLVPKILKELSALAEAQKMAIAKTIKNDEQLLKELAGDQSRLFLLHF